MSNAQDVAVAVQDVAAKLLAAIVDPSDAIRLLSSLSDYYPTVSLPNSQQGAAMATMQTASVNLCRRAAVVALARAAATYQPSSYDDAVTVRNKVVALLDNEITVAGDSGEDATFNALRNLRVAVVQDLNSRGATLSRIKTFKTPAPRPVGALAYSIYGDATRDDELLSQVDPIHPAFMPTTFNALAE